MSDTNTSAPSASSAEVTDSSAVDNTSDSQIVETPKVSPKLSRALKLKLEGEEVEEKLPFEIDENNKEQVEYLKRHLQLSKVASKRMNEASITKKQAEQFFQALQTNPEAILTDPRIMGSEKLQALAESFLAKKLQEQMLSPEQRKQIEMEQKLKQYEEQEKAAKEKQEAEQRSQLEEHYAQTFEKTIVGALQASNLPKNPYTVQRMAALMQKNLQHGLELEPQHLAQIVREDYQRELVSLIGGSDADQILAMFGDDLSKKIRQADLAKLRAGQIRDVTPKTTQAPAQQPSKPMTMSEWKAKNGSF